MSKESSTTDEGRTEPIIKVGFRSILVMWNTVLDHLVPLPKEAQDAANNIDWEKSGPTTITEGVGGKLIVSHNTVLKHPAPLPRWATAPEDEDIKK